MSTRRDWVIAAIATGAAAIVAVVVGVGLSGVLGGPGPADPGTSLESPQPVPETPSPTPDDPADEPTPTPAPEPPATVEPTPPPADAPAPGVAPRDEPPVELDGICWVRSGGGWLGAPCPDDAG